MRFKTHLAFGLLVAFVLKNYYSISMLCFFLVVLLSVLADIDLHTSFIGKRLKGLSYLIELFFKHRGFFHSLWIPAILYLILVNYSLELAIFGYLGHILLDLFTEKGVALLWPFLRIKGEINTGGLSEKIFFLVVSIVDLFYLIGMVSRILGL